VQAGTKAGGPRADAGLGANAERRSSLDTTTALATTSQPATGTGTTAAAC
jgi:hypothetical protein